MLPKRVLYCGVDEPLPKRIPLRAGPLSLIYEDGDLRSIRLGEHELIRRIYVAVRDKDWGTVPPVLSNVEITGSTDAFRISYAVENRQDDIDFCWKGAISGDAWGAIRFEMEGVARSTFWRNRIGFCVLHPAALAGAACIIEHTDRRREDSVLPTTITADQPVRPFYEMSALTHSVQPGLWVEVRFSGDTFEMEDQRNWTDASYKTFCTPLHLPRPVQVNAGERVSQAVTLTLLGNAAPARQPARRQASEAAPVLVTIEQGTAGSALPRLGLGVASHDQPLNKNEVARLQLLGLDHLRVDLALSSATYAARLALAAEQARALGISLHVALLVGEQSDQELAQLREALQEIQPPVAAWLVYPARELLQGGSPVRRVVAAARQRLTDYALSARFVAGSNADFIFMLRSLPPLELVDGVAFPIQPQVHAFDNVSLVETLAAQATVVSNAWRLAGGRPVFVSPITLKQRFNPYASGGGAPALADALPPQVDARQMSLFGAGWTLGSLKYLAEGGAHSATYFETTGWRGVMETAGGSPLPRLFPSLPGMVFPIFHVLADVGECRGAGVLPVTSSEPLAVEGIALRRGHSLRLLLANLAPEPQDVLVRGVQGALDVRFLDETNAEEALLQPETFRRAAGRQLGVATDGFLLHLPPFGLARMDGQASA